MLLHRPPRGGLVSRDKLVRRFDLFSRSEWSVLIEASAACDEQAAVGQRRRRRNAGPPERRCWSIWENSLPPDSRWRGVQSPLVPTKLWQCRSARREGSIEDDGRASAHSVGQHLQFQDVLQGLREIGASPDSIIDDSFARKPHGGVRGIIGGDVIRRFVARTIALELAKTVEAATVPYQFRTFHAHRMRVHRTFFAGFV